MSNIKKAVNLTNFLVSLPKIKYLLSCMLLIGVLFGVLASFIVGNISFETIFQGSLEGLFLLSIPALLSSILLKLILRKILFRRIVAASLIGQIIYAIAYFLYLILLNTSFQHKEVVLFLAASLAFVIWFLIARLVFILKWRAFLFSALQIIIYGIFLFTGKIITVSGDPFIIILKFFIASTIFLAFVYLFFLIINAPMKRSFGLNTLDAASMFLAHWFYESKNIEEEFERIGEEVTTILSVFLFKRKEDTISFVIPYIHYGPFGSLGGSNFSSLIAEELKKSYGIKAFVFHGTSTHDFNPVASNELKKIISSFDEGYKNCNFSNSSVAYAYGRSKECFAQSLIFKNCAFVGVSRAPYTTEDINFGLGLAIMEACEKHIPSVSIIDQHNAETGEITSFEPGSAIGFNYLNAACRSVGKKIKGNELQIGVSQKHISLSALGPGGIKIAVVSTTPKYVIVLIDSNGVKPEAREKIVSEVKKIGKENKTDFEVGVYTTDMHTLNAVRGAVNPVSEDTELFKIIKEGVLEALEDIKPAKFSFFKRYFKINVLGAKQSIELISTLNAIISVAKIAAPLIIIGSIISILWIISKI